MIKMKSKHPLLVGGEARTEFETDEQHARELESSGLAIRDIAEDELVASVAPQDSQESVAVVTDPAPEPVAAATPAKTKKAK